jgi:hypothetical protein
MAGMLGIGFVGFLIDVALRAGEAAVKKRWGMAS